jgi:hypothetical protein
MRAEGIRLSTPSHLETRLDALVSTDFLTISEAKIILDQKCIQAQLDSRENRFWMVSHRLPMDDGGVKLLLETWGGEEIASQFLENHKLLVKLQSIGRPRMIEVAVPLSITGATCSAASAAVATYARQNGWTSKEDSFDFCVKESLPSDTVLSVFTQDNAG